MKNTPNEHSGKIFLKSPSGERVCVLYEREGIASGSHLEFSIQIIFRNTEHNFGKEVSLGGYLCRHNDETEIDKITRQFRIDSIIKNDDEEALAAFSSTTGDFYAFYALTGLSGFQSALKDALRSNDIEKFGPALLEILFPKHGEAEFA